MTLTLGKDIEVKMWFDNRVYIGRAGRVRDVEISLADFLSAAYYVLTNTDLEPNDPRLAFLKVVKEMAVISGYTAGESRLDYKSGWSLCPPDWYNLSGVEDDSTIQTYFKLKKQKAQEQGKNYWFEAVLTDEEANIRHTNDSSRCSSCKSLSSTFDTCRLGHKISSTTEQVCDEWRYFA